MPSTFQVIEAKPFMCGRMARLLRLEHQEGALRIGLDAHRGLRTTFDKSYYRKAWLIDEDLAALGGVQGTIMSPSGFIWLALSQKATRYPIAIVKEARRQLDEIMKTKLELHTTIIGGDEAAKRLVAFLGFHVADHGPGAPAETRYGRKRLIDHIDHEPALRIPFGSGYAVMVGFHRMEENHG